MKNDKQLVFWDGSGKILPTQMFNFFGSIGIGLYHQEESKRKESTPRVVQVVNNVATEISDSYLMQVAKEHILAQTEEGGNAEPITDSLHRSTGLFSSKNLNLLQYHDIEFIEDTRDSTHFFFRNGVIKVTSDNVELIPYENIEGCVWSSNIINHDIAPTRTEESVFESFLQDVTSVNDKQHWIERFMSLKSTIGYLLSRYKHEGITKAIIYMDEYSTGIPNGGSGKTLIAKAIGELRKVHITDGKQYDSKRWFKFTNVSLSTNVMVFDDIQKSFDFEHLFPMTTTGIEIVRKYKDPYYIPYSKSPKLLITTNYAVNGEGGSFNRRVFEFEISHYYSDTRRPDEKFGHLFFTDWNSDQYNSFYNLMFHCAQLYLEQGFIESAPLNIKRTKLINQTSEEFIEFAEDQIKFEVKYDKKELLQLFTNMYPEWRSLPPRRFLDWLRRWGKFKGIVPQESHSNTIRYILFQNPKKSE